MRIHEKQGASERVVLEGNLAEFREALEEEIETIKKNGQSSILLSNGRCVDSRGEEVWYRFSVEYAPTLAPDTPCKLIIGKDQFDVTVVSYEENAIILSSKLPLPEMLGSARLENGATVLMERLIKCIEKNAEKVNLAGSRMLPQGGKFTQQKKLLPTVAQYEKRSAFAKFFSGKSALTQAQAILETVRMRLAECRSGPEKAVMSPLRRILLC